MLKIDNLSKKYNNQIILNNVSIEFKEGNLYILSGINGSGKSTLVKLLSGIIYKSSGTIANDISISYLPDKFTMPKLLKVSAYCKLLAIPLELMEKYQIPNKRIGELSKGNLQKLGIIQILNRESDCYILDEPLDGLDDSAKKLLKQDIINLKANNKIIIMCLHTKTLFNELHPIEYEVKGGFVNEKKRRSVKNPS